MTTSPVIQFTKKGQVIEPVPLTQRLEENDLKVLNQNSEYLNGEAEDVLVYQNILSLGLEKKNKKGGCVMKKFGLFLVCVLAASTAWADGFPMGQKIGMGWSWNYLEGENLLGHQEIFVERVDDLCSQPGITYRLDGKETSVVCTIYRSVGYNGKIKKWFKKDAVTGLDAGVKYVIVGERKGRTLLYLKAKFYTFLK